MRDFWLSCGHHLLDRDAGGGLLVTDEFLKAYLARPELAPPPEACVVEKTLHAALLADPRRPVGADEIAAIADADARENWDIMIAFRDHLLAHATLEAAYVALVRRGPGRTPPLFINQLVHVILRNVLDGCDDAHVLRAAELFFRPQRVTLHEGSLLAADEERIAGSNPAPVSPLVSMLGLEKSADIDVLVDDNAQDYFERSDAYDTAARERVPERPSSYIPGRVYGCIFDDVQGLLNRDYVGMGQIMFETDYPHADSFFPHSIKVAEKLIQAANLNEHETWQFLRGNAIECYDLGRYAITK